MLKLAWKYMRYYKSQTFAIFASIVLTAALLAGTGSLMYSSRRSDIENSKTVYGDWHYRAEVDAKTYRMVGNGKADDGESDRGASGSGESDRGYVLEQCGKKEVRDAVDEPYLIWFVHADESYLQMVHRDLLEGTYPQAENEIAADLYALSNLGGTGTVGESITVDGKSYTVTGILVGEWAANANEMELFVGDSFTGRGSQTFLYLRFAEDKPLYRQMDAFQRKYRISSEMTETNAEVTQYLGGEPPESIVDIVKFGLTEEQGNFTYIILKLESEYHLSYYGMTLLLCLFSLFVVYSVFNISASKRTAEYGMMQTLGISEKRIGFTLVLELWMLFAAGYPLGCLLGNGVLGFFYRSLEGVFANTASAGNTGIAGNSGISAGSAGTSISDGVSAAGGRLSAVDQTLAQGGEPAKFYIAWDVMAIGLVILFVSLALIGFLTVYSLRKRSLKDVISGDTSFIKRRKIYAKSHADMAGVLVRKFMFSNKRKVLGILLSLSVGGCIFLCTTYMVENLKVHAELSLKSDDGLGSEYRVSLRSSSLADMIPANTVSAIRGIPGTADVFATKYTLGELLLTEEEYLFDPGWQHYFDEKNEDSYFIQRYGGICVQKEDGTYGIKYDVYGYDDGMVEELSDFILEGEIDPERMRAEDQIIAVANVDGQGNYYFYGKKPGDTITLRVPEMDGYSDELLRFEDSSDRYVTKEFEIAAIVSRPLAQEDSFMNVDAWSNTQSVILTNGQMENDFGITGYSFINASPDGENVSGQILQAIRDVPKAVLVDYTSAIQTQKNYLDQQQMFFSCIAGILLVISLFHIVNSMNYSILARRREYGIIRAMGITDAGFCRMILQTGILYGILADVFIFLIYNLFLRRVMDYYMTHVVQFLHLSSGVPGVVFFGVMALNVLIAAVAVMVPARRMVRENIIEEIR
ncbi:MAG TPA: FtsX-like permease family protein [Candidatus Mediterraneibacter cottocaccae]|nr:FtsX-like permease family protein [Candidatus Mediterraneibacter cottocaccae]